jgi:CO/xanthine dehydrogenase Mo-binding subunit
MLITDAPGPGPFGAKSAGELANPAVAAAIANAIDAAVGVRVMSLPITAEKVRAELAKLEGYHPMPNGGTADSTAGRR